MAVPDTQVEIERKYDVAPDVDAPGLDDLGVRTAKPVEHELVATYFDTADLRLARAGTTLRRRTGGADEGWHLKIPLAAGERLEVHRPLGRATRTVPAALASLVRVHVRGQPLVPVARLSTHRTVRRLLDGAGIVAAELADDRVVGERLDGAAAPVRWRELEVELVEGDPALLELIEGRLLAAGATPSASGSKLARVLGDSGAMAATRPTDSRAETDAAAPLSPESAAGDVLVRHLGEQVTELISWDPRVRTDVFDSVHKMRVATRRLRSALATYRPLLHREVTDPVRDELKWLGSVLGVPRDAEVMHERLRSALASEPPELVLGPVRRRVDRELRGRYRAGHAAAVAELDGERYFRLLDLLEGMLAEPPLTERARRPADRELPRLVGRTWRRVQRAAHAVDAATSPEERDLRLHEVRKSAKRARYAGESVAPVFGPRAARFAKRMEAMQDLLGEHQDTVVTRQLLRELGVQSHLAGENGFTFGRLHALQQCRAETLEKDYAGAWARLSSKRFGWLS